MEMKMKIKTVLLAIPLALFSLPLLAQDNAMQITEDGTVGVGAKIHVGSTATPVGQFTITSVDQPRFEPALALQRDQHGVHHQQPG
jgi:hypothetical protein